MAGVTSRLHCMNSPLLLFKTTVVKSKRILNLCTCVCELGSVESLFGEHVDEVTQFDDG